MIEMLGILVGFGGPVIVIALLAYGKRRSMSDAELEAALVEAKRAKLDHFDYLGKLGYRSVDHTAHKLCDEYDALLLEDERRHYDRARKAERAAK